MKLRLIFFILFGCICAGGFWAQAQTVEQLRKERKEIQARINATNKQLQQVQKNEKASKNKLVTLRNNLSDRRKLINTYTTEIDVLSRKMEQLASERTRLEQKLDTMKHEYARLIQNTQLNRNSYSKLMFLLSAKNFDQTIRRARYLQEFADFKKTQVNQIEFVKKEIEQKTDSLNKNKGSKLNALKNKEIESNELKREETDEKKLLAQIQSEEKKLASEYRAHQQKRDQIDHKIQQVIAEEIRKAEAKRKAEEARQKAEAKRKADELAKQKAAKSKPKTTAKQPATKPVSAPTEIAEAKKPAPSPSVSALTREEQLLAGGFAKNRGRLPWPVERGAISGRFGTQPHPELRHVTINNRGTYFRSPSGTDARAVYEGVVTRRFALPGSGSAVIIQHGSYRTVYGNLSSVYVREGERVSAKQAIGKIYTDEQSGQAELQFQIWSGSSMVNPEGWITK